MTKFWILRGRNKSYMKKKKKSQNPLPLQINVWELDYQFHHLIYFGKKEEWVINFGYHKKENE